MKGRTEKGRTVRNLVAADEDALCAMLDDADTFEAMRKVAMRENRSCWLWQHNLDVIAVVREASAWLKGAAKPPPPAMVSAALRPGGDSDLKYTHQRKAFARAAVRDGRIDTHNFRLMKVTDYKLVEELEKIAATPLTTEAREHLDDYYGYQARALRNGHDQALLRKTLEEKADEYCAILKKLSERFDEKERERLGEDMMTPGERVILDAVVRLGKTPPASSTAQQWVLGKWTYYGSHPEALRGAQERKRVYARDVWETVREEAEKKGVGSFREFRKILRTAQQGLRRANQKPNKKGIAR